MSKQIIFRGDTVDNAHIRVYYKGVIFTKKDLKKLYKAYRQFDRIRKKWGTKKSSLHFGNINSIAWLRMRGLLKKTDRTGEDNE